MPRSLATEKIANMQIPLSTISERLTALEAVRDEHEHEVLAFLTARSVPAVFMHSLIRDNGIESPFNRGLFYVQRDAEGRIAGVALIGHATLIETESDDAMRAFADIAQMNPNAHVIMGDEEKIKRFWSYYAPAGQSARLVCRELLFEKNDSLSNNGHADVPLRQATLKELSEVMLAQAEMAREESGVNPLETDPMGFRLRCARRIEQGRVWVWVENDRLIFKADVLAETPHTVYLEGIYVDGSERGKSYGLRCLSRLDHLLLRRADSICLLVNERCLEAQSFYAKAGYKMRGYYDTIFLQPEE